jgi:hypothetical protein
MLGSKKQLKKLNRAIKIKDVFGLIKNQIIFAPDLKDSSFEIHLAR